MPLSKGRGTEDIQCSLREELPLAVGTSIPPEDHPAMAMGASPSGILFLEPCIHTDHLDPQQVVRRLTSVPEPGVVRVRTGELRDVLPTGELIALPAVVEVLVLVAAPSELAPPLAGPFLVPILRPAASAGLPEGGARSAVDAAMAHGVWYPAHLHNPVIDTMG